MHAAEIARIRSHVPRDLGLGDRERHSPGRIEIDRGDVGGERRRRLVDLADDDAVAALDLAVGDGLDESGGNVHHDVALGEQEIHAEESFQRSFELLDAVADRDIHRLQGLRADRSAGVEPMAQLKFLDARDDDRVVAVARLRARGHIIGDDKALAQQRDVRAARAGRKLGVGRQRRPAAAHLNVRIAEQCLLDAQIGAVVKDGVRRQSEFRSRTRFRRGSYGRRWLGRLRRGLCRGAGLAGDRLRLAGHGLRRTHRRLAADLRQHRTHHDRENGACDKNGPHRPPPLPAKVLQQLPSRFCLILCRFHGRTGSNSSTTDKHRRI